MCRAASAPSCVPTATRLASRPGVFLALACSSASSHSNSYVPSTPQALHVRLRRALRSCSRWRASIHWARATRCASSLTDCTAVPVVTRSACCGTLSSRRSSTLDGRCASMLIAPPPICMLTTLPRARSARLPWMKGARLSRSNCAEGGGRTTRGPWRTAQVDG